MIKIEHLRKEYENATPLKDVNVEINDGDVISIIGPSGTGKSTLMRCINRLDTPTSGKIWVNGVDVTDPATDLSVVRRKMGMVFQAFNLFEHLTVIENIMFAPVELLGKSKQEAADRAMELLEKNGFLPDSYRPHLLHGKRDGQWECHIEPDWLLIWEQYEEELLMLMINTGSHSDLFGKK